MTAALVEHQDYDKTGATIASGAREVNLVGGESSTDMEDLGYYDGLPDFMDPEDTLQACEVITKSEVCVGEYSRLGQPRDATLNEGKPPGERTRRRRDPTPNTICWRCYAKGSHYAYGCNVDIKANRRVVVANFESLTAKEKMRVATGSYCYLKGWYHEGLEQVDGPWVNPFAQTKPRVRIQTPDELEKTESQKPQGTTGSVMTLGTSEPDSFSFAGRVTGPWNVTDEEAEENPAIAQIKALIMKLHPEDRARLETECCFLGRRENYKVLGGLGTSKSRMHRRPMLIDTGAGPNCIREDILPRGSRSRLKQSDNHRVFDANGNLLPIAGTVYLTVRIGSCVEPTVFLVCKKLQVPVLLGTDFMDRHVKAIIPSTRWF